MQLFMLIFVIYIKYTRQSHEWGWDAGYLLGLDGTSYGKLIVWEGECRDNCKALEIKMLHKDFHLQPLRKRKGAFVL